MFLQPDSSFEPDTVLALTRLLASPFQKEKPRQSIGSLARVIDVGGQACIDDVESDLP